MHRARLLPSGRVVAVKRLHNVEARYKRRLRREAVLLESLDHPSIVQLYGVREDKRGLCLIMELVDGCTLADLMDSLALPPPVVLCIARALFQALDHAHSKGVVHRDISPRNVLLSYDGESKLADFGLSRSEGCPPTTDGMLRGTVPYVSPEQLQGQEVDHRSDLFAVGVLLYELIAGRLPFEGDIMLCVAQILRGAPISSLRTVAPWVSEELDRLVMKLLERDVNERYQSAAEVLSDLPTVADGREELVVVMDALRAPATGGAGRRFFLAAALFAGLGLFGLQYLDASGSADVSIDGEVQISDEAETPERVRAAVTEPGSPDERVQTQNLEVRTISNTIEDEAAVPGKPRTRATKARIRKRPGRLKLKRRVYTQEPPKRRVFTQDPEPGEGEP